MQKQTTSPKNEKFRQFYQQVYPKIKNRHTPYAIAQKILHPRMFYAARLLDEAIMDEKRKAFEGLFSDNSPVAAAILDKEGRITKANKKLHEIMESQEGGLLGTQMFLADGLGKILPSKIQEGSG
ncbi:MAG: hypothetical protein N3F07_03745, partial [Candidatus Micrarchaeota archaeon]|nr:hypothetical protein [Candidatus Micrarchaeota archaeon]